MIVEIDELQRQQADISCLTDDLIKTARKLSTVAQTTAQSGVDTSLAYAYNTLTIRRLQKTIDMFSLILETLGTPVALANVSDNVLKLQPQLHSDSSSDVRPTA